MYEPERLTSFDLVLAFDSYSAPVDAGAFNTNGMHGVLMIIQCGSGRACAMNIDNKYKYECECEYERVS